MTLEKPPRRSKAPIVVALIGLVGGIIAYYATSSAITSLITLFVTSGLIGLSLYAKYKIEESGRVKKMEDAFPDFLELMSSNLRAGMTIDRALLASSREEFAPLDQEIIKLGKDIATGKNIERALKDMAERIHSERIRKTMLVIISGIKAGGNLATLLEETAVNTRERSFVEKRAASNVLMYVIFIAFAISLGAPILFGLSTALVEIITRLLASIPPMDNANIQLPFTLTQVNISVTFVTYFSILFLLVTDILGCLVLGAVSKGEEKAGVKYMVPIIVVSITVFFVVKKVLLSYFANFLG